MRDVAVVSWPASNSVAIWIVKALASLVYDLEGLVEHATHKPDLRPLDPSALYSGSRIDLPSEVY